MSTMNQQPWQAGFDPSPTHNPVQIFNPAGTPQDGTIEGVNVVGANDWQTNWEWGGDEATAFDQINAENQGHHGTAEGQPPQPSVDVQFGYPTSFSPVKGQQDSSYPVQPDGSSDSTGNYFDEINANDASLHDSFHGSLHASPQRDEQGWSQWNQENAVPDWNGWRNSLDTSLESSNPYESQEQQDGVDAASREQAEALPHNVDLVAAMGGLSLEKPTLSSPDTARPTRDETEVQSVPVAEPEPYQSPNHVEVQSHGPSFGSPRVNEFPHDLQRSGGAVSSPWSEDVRTFPRMDAVPGPGTPPGPPAGMMYPPAAKSPPKAVVASSPSQGNGRRLRSGRRQTAETHGAWWKAWTSTLLMDFSQEWC